mgnify:CR=1 FL=1|jgi:N4-gp56 family major capsid protein
MAELNPIPTPAYNGTSTHNMDTFNPRGHLHNDPTGINGTPVPSTIGQQSINAYYLKKTLKDAAKKRKFGALADVTTMPKYMGKRIRAYVEIPLLDDRNLNDQGIDALGAQIRNGNLYGSSKDIGKILGRIPVVSEIGGRVNRVGFQRREIEGTFNKFGFFYEWSNEFEAFDSDPNVLASMYSRAIEGAEQIYETMLQIDLLNGAGTLVYAGTAVSDATMDKDCVVTVNTLSRLSQALTANRTPKNTKIITGSTMQDTRTATTHRILFVGSELKPVLERLLDNFGNPAFIPAHKYGAATKLMEDEIGIIGDFRVIEVEEMTRWAGAGAAEDPNANMYATNGKYDIFPMLCIGSESFTTIGFQTGGKGSKFVIQTKKPEAHRDDPYGEIGFTSIKWYYGIMFLRPERIGLIKTVAPY